MSTTRSLSIIAFVLHAFLQPVAFGSNSIDRERLCRSLPEGDVCTKLKLPAVVLESPPEGSIESSQQGLKIRLQSGKNIVLKDNPGPGFESRKYTYAGYVRKISYHSVIETGWEWTSYRFVSHLSGDSHSFDWEPVFSPNVDYLYVFKYPAEIHPDIDHPVAIEIYKVSQSGFRLVSSVDRPREILSTLLIWVDDMQIAIFTEKLPNGLKSDAPILIGRIKYVGGKWVVMPVQTHSSAR